MSAKEEDAEKIKNLWKMLDDMAENDPEAYERFVKKNAGGMRKTLRPKAGAVLKGFALNEGTMKKIFINLTSHPAVTAPTGANGKELDDDAPAWAAREIPLLVGVLRKMTDKKNATCLVVDVVFSPWVLKRLESKDERDSEFKDHVANLAANWVKDEHNLRYLLGNTSSLCTKEERESEVSILLRSPNPRRKRRERKHQKKKKQKRTKRM